MRRDKQGHVWKWGRDSGYAVCPFCGIERKPALRGPKGAKVEGFRPIGSGKPWSRSLPRCAQTIKIGRSIVWHARAVVMGIVDWPARFLCFRDGRPVTVPVLAYWRDRRG
jgi:hypothetical protein